MPNINAPSGLTPVMYRNANKWNGQGRLYAIAASDTNAYYVGDPVKIDATNFADNYGIQYVTRATAGATCRGVICSIGVAVVGGPFQGGPYINPNDLTKAFRPSGAQASVYYAFVADDPDIVFEIQEDLTGSAGAAAQITKNANFKFNSIPAGVFVSQVTLDSSSYATTATLNLKVLQAVQRPDNTPFTSYQRLLVTINNHDFSGGVAGY